MKGNTTRFISRNIISNSFWGKDVFQAGLVNDRKLHRITKPLLRSAPDNVKISASELPRNSMFIHHINGIDWLVITAFEELKTMFIEEAGTIPSCFSTASELNLVDQAKRTYRYLPTLSGVITDIGTYQRQGNEEDLNPQLACLVEGHGRVFIYHGGFVAFVDDEQTFITRID
ncbi:MAG: hypothetical protein ACI88H_002036 [Cocleimonas sp.]